MPEIEIRLVDRGELKFDKFFLQFNVRQKNVCKKFFKRKFSISQ